MPNSIEEGIVKEGVITVIPAPQRGKQAEPIPDELVSGVVEALNTVQKGMLVATGRHFPKAHQGQAYGKRLLDELRKRDEAGELGELGLSVRPVTDALDPTGKLKGRFILAVRRA